MNLKKVSWITSEAIVLATERAKLYILLQAAGFHVSVMSFERVITQDTYLYEGHIGHVVYKGLFPAYRTSRERMRFDYGDDIDHVFSKEELIEHLIKMIQNNESEN